jgi:hypothetical protein
MWARLAWLLAGCVAAEGVARLLYRTVLPRIERLQNGRTIVERMAEGRTEVAAQIISHPYVLYANAPGFHDAGFRQINALGYRGPDVTIEKPPGLVRILALGGSTTLSYPFVKDPARTWVATLEDRLNQAAGARRFQVINAGLPYATSAELLAGYVFRHRFLQPDLVVIHEGGNDAVALMYPGYHPEYTHLRAAANTARPRPGERLLLRLRAVRLAYVLCGCGTCPRSMRRNHTPTRAWILPARWRASWPRIPWDLRATWSC